MSKQEEEIKTIVSNFNAIAERNKTSPKPNSKIYLIAIVIAVVVVLIGLYYAKGFLEKKKVSQKQKIEKSKEQ